MRSRSAFRTLRAGSRAAALLSCAALLAVAATGCGKRKTGNGDTISTYRADFKTDKELANWKCSDQGKWELRDGWLVGDARGTSPSRSILWLSFPLPEASTVEFEAECLDQPGDLGAFVCGDGRGYSGYEIMLGGSDGKRIGAYRSTKDGDASVRKRLGREAFDMAKNRSYAVKIKKSRTTIRLYVNEDLFITASDEKPVSDDTHRYFGLSTVGNLVRFNNLKIEAKR